MANRRSSWRRAPTNTQPHHRRPQKNQTTLPFSGIEDHAVLTLFTHLLAKKVNVNAANGAVYTGLFAGTQHSPNSNDLLLTLRYARLVRGKPVPTATVHDLRGNTASRILIPFSRVTTVMGVPFENTKRGFATDSQITRGSAGVGRQLQRFEDFSNIQAVDSNNSATLDQRTFGSLANSAARQKWDQFQVNQAKFGVTTSFDESEYTTTIDRNSKDYAARQREAQRLAEEIESAPSQNVHIREERNQEVGNDYEDEEARYSEVQRPQTAPQPVSRPQVPAKDPVPEKPRLSYAAAAAGGANLEARQHIAAKPPSAGSTHGPQSINKSTPMHVKNAPAASKGSAPAGSRHSQQGGKVPQDQNAKYSQASSRASHSASGKNASTSGKGAAHTAKSVNKKNPVTNKPQQSQGKSGGANNRASNQVSTNKSSTQPVSSRPAAQGVNTKSAIPPNRQGQATSSRGSDNAPKQLNYAAASAGNSKAAPASTRSQTQTNASQEKAQTKSAKANTLAQSGNKETISGDTAKVTGGERVNQGSSSQAPKVRATLNGRNSPNQSRNSPLPTSTVVDTSAIGVLNLDAQTPKLGPEQIKRFQEFKTKREEQKVKTNRDLITHSLKKFSTQLESKNGSLRRGQNGGSSAPDTPRAAAKSAKNVPESGTDEKPAEDLIKKDLVPAKEETQPREKDQEEKEKKPAKSEEGAIRPRPKTKLRLNPNAQEFKLNPDAPSFTPASQKTQSQNPAPYTAYNNQPTGQVEFSQPMQVPSGYPMPIQAMTPIAYGPQSYVVVPSRPTPVGGGNAAYPFVPQPPSFGPAHVGGRFPQSAAMPVSYGYQHVTPMVIAQPPQPRVQASPYYHNTAAYGGPQAAPGHLPGHQPHLYQQGAPTHMQPGTFPMTGRGGHGNPRRGANRSRGKPAAQQSYAHTSNQISGERPTPDGVRAPDATQR